MEMPDTTPERRVLAAQPTSAFHLLKYWRREIQAEFRRIAFQIKLMCLLDPAAQRDVDRFHLSAPLDRFLETEYGLQRDRSGMATSVDINELLRRAKSVPGKALRRALKLIRRQLRGDICRLVEKAQLLRVLDPQFDAEIERLGWTQALDMIARWHAMEAWAVTARSDRSDGSTSEAAPELSDPRICASSTP